MRARKLLATEAPAAVILVRLIVGVFLSEGIQKFLLPGDLGAGRFVKIGLPAPEVLAPIVATFEIMCGSLVSVGLATRLAAVPLVAIMLVAISTTKIPMLMSKGFWTMAHEARADWSMLLGSVYLIVVGAGAWSMDAMTTRRTGRLPFRASRK